MGGPGRLAGIRVSARSNAPPTPTRTAAAPRRCRGAGRMTLSEIPLAEPVIGEREEELVLEVAALGAALAGADAGALRARVRRLSRGRRRGRRLLGNRGAPPRRARARLGRGRRGRHLAVQLRRLGQLPALRGRDAGLLRRRPGDAQPRPGGGRGRDRRAHRGPAPGRHPRLPGRDRRSSSGSPPSAGLGLLEDACEALGARDPEGRLGRVRAATSPRLRSTPTSR